MTTAHLFYIPVILFVGLFAGFYLGRRAAEDQMRQRRKKRKRREALKKKRADKKEQNNVSTAKDAKNAKGKPNTV